jgi:ABC-type lipoprotein release transport system permease subunit
VLIAKLAFRGLIRHRMRTFFTLGAIAIGTFFLLVFMAFSEGGLGDMVELAVRQGTSGHVVVQAKGYGRTAAMDLLVERGDEIRRQIKERMPEARVVLRVFGGGMAASASDSVGVQFAGVEPGLESRVSELARKVRQGVYLGARPSEVDAAERRLRQIEPGPTAVGVAEPKPIVPDDPQPPGGTIQPLPSKTPGVLWCARPAPRGTQGPRPVVIGTQLAQTLRLGLCDKLVIRAQGLGAQEEGHFRIVGLFQTGSLDLDGFFAQIHLADAQRLLSLENGVHQVAVMLGSAKEATEAVRTIGKALGHDESLEVLSWDEAMPQMAEFVMFKAVSGWVFIAVVILIVAIGVANTVLMSVMERTREFGVIRAMGSGPGRIFALVLTEGAMIGAFGALAGLALALPMLHYLSTTGIVYDKPVEAAGVAIQAVKAHATPLSIAFGCVVVFVITLLSAVPPAIRAARLRMLDALYRG